MNTDRQTIDELLEELRRAGRNPKPELRAAIKALGPGAIPALIALIRDPANYEMREDEEDISYWAPYPAVEILGELHPPEAFEPLLSLITWDDYDYLEDVVPEALANYGGVALAPLTAVLADQGRSVWTRVRAVSAMEKMAGVHPELRDEIVARLTAQLDTSEPENEELDTLWGFLVEALVQLDAEESVPSIIRAFEETAIDPYLVSWSDARHQLGIPPEVAPHLDEISPKRWSPFQSTLLQPGAAPPPGLASPAVRSTQREQAQPYRREMPKVGRNDPCPCGSGKKYKKCHGR